MMAHLRSHYVYPTSPIETVVCVPPRAACALRRARSGYKNCVISSDLAALDNLTVLSTLVVELAAASDGENWRMMGWVR